MTAYLDTNVVLWLAERNLERITPAALDLIREAKLLVSPMLLLELEYLFEVGRLALTSTDLMLKLRHQVGVEVCDLAFPLVAEIAVSEHWTRDPFDRVIVAQAKANGFATLITADRIVGQNYPKALW